MAFSLNSRSYRRPNLLIFDMVVFSPPSPPSAISKKAQAHFSRYTGPLDRAFSPLPISTRRPRPSLVPRFDLGWYGLGRWPSIAAFHWMGGKFPLRAGIRPLRALRGLRGESKRRLWTGTNTGFFACRPLRVLGAFVVKTKRRCGVDRGGEFFRKGDEPMPLCSVQRSIRASGRVFAESNGASVHPGGVVQRAAIQPGARASPCGLQRGNPATGRVCAVCSDPVGRAGGSLQSAAGHSFTGNGSLQRALRHPVTGNAFIFNTFLQRHTGVAFSQNPLPDLEEPGAK